MFSKLSVALMIVAIPAAAQEPGEPVNTDAAQATESKPVAYKTKKVCRTTEVVGSAIPKRTCSTKRIPIEPAEDEAVAEADTRAQPESER